jgi:hypothetical protein
MSDLLRPVQWRAANSFDSRFKGQQSVKPIANAEAALALPRQFSRIPPHTRPKDVRYISSTCYVDVGAAQYRRLRRRPKISVQTLWRRTAFLAYAGIMSKERPIATPANSLQRDSGAPIPPSIHDCLDALLVAFQYELDQILQRAKASEERFEASLQDATLLTREEAAQRMRVSLATLDRKAKRNEIAATYIDTRPRFRISEIVRYLDARTESSARRSLRRRS